MTPRVGMLLRYFVWVMLGVYLLLWSLQILDWILVEALLIGVIPAWAEDAF